MKKIGGIVITLVIIVVLIISGFFILNKNYKDDNKNNNENLSMEQRIKNEYSKSLELYEDYRIDSVEILSEERTKEIIKLDNGQYYEEGDVLAIITYAIKSDEMAGNGEKSGDWVINKTVCIAFRDGKIVSEGTGW